VRAAACRATPMCGSRRSASSTTAESQQKVRIPIVYLAAMLIVIPNTAPVCRPRTCRPRYLQDHPKCTVPLDIWNQASKTDWNCRRNEGRSISSTSFPPKTLHHKQYWMLWEVSCKVGSNKELAESPLTAIRQILRRIPRSTILWWQRIY